MPKDCESHVEAELFAKDGASSLKDASNYGATTLAAGQIPRQLLVVCALICSVELCERLAFYTFNGTQVFFLERVGDSLAAASAINASMVTLCMAWTILGGWMADSILGRFWTIMSFGTLYVVGCCLAAWSAMPLHESRNMYLVGMMVFIPLGTAGIKANISNFGAEQFDTSTPEGEKAQEQFFSWFYVAVNLGAGVSYGFLTTFGSTGGFGVPSQYGYLTVYAIAAGAMLLAVGIFFSGRRLYIMHPPHGSSSLGAAWRYLHAACQKGVRKAIGTLLGFVFVVVGLSLSVLASLLYWKSYVTALVWCAAIAAGLGVALIISCNIRPDWAEGVRLPDERFSADEVSDYFRILPVLILGQLSFGPLYNSMGFWYQIQACQMDLRIWPGSDLNSQQVSGSFFNIADCFAIVVGTPLILGVIHPAVERATGFTLTYSVKYTIGMVVGVLSVCIAASLELQRRSSGRMEVGSNCAPNDLHMSSMSAHYMLIPFFLMGIAEIYVLPTLMFFAYTQSPKSMRTLSAVTSLFMMGIGSALFSVNAIALSKFVPDDLNNGHLEYGYFANIACAIVWTGLFFVVKASFQEKSFS